MNTEQSASVDPSPRMPEQQELTPAIDVIDDGKWTMELIEKNEERVVVRINCYAHDERYDTGRYDRMDVTEFGLEGPFYVSDRGISDTGALPHGSACYIPEWDVVLVSSYLSECSRQVSYYVLTHELGHRAFRDVDQSSLTYSEKELLAQKRASELYGDNPLFDREESDVDIKYYAKQAEFEKNERAKQAPSSDDAATMATEATANEPTPNNSVDETEKSDGAEMAEPGFAEARYKEMKKAVLDHRQEIERLRLTNSTREVGGKIYDGKVLLFDESTWKSDSVDVPDTLEERRTWGENGAVYFHTHPPYGVGMASLGDIMCAIHNLGEVVFTPWGVLMVIPKEIYSLEQVNRATKLAGDKYDEILTDGWNENEAYYGYLEEIRNSLPFETFVLEGLSLEDERDSHDTRWRHEADKQNKSRSFFDKLFGKGKVTYIDIAQEEAIEDEKITKE